MVFEATHARYLAPAETKAVPKSVTERSTLPHRCEVVYALVVPPIQRIWRRLDVEATTAELENKSHESAHARILDYRDFSDYLIS